ncbi:MAG: hypothetical protein WDN28_30470 [Chthoniobacter sp.]
MDESNETPRSAGCCDWRKTVDDLSSRTEKLVREDPAKAVGIALFTGVLLTVLRSAVCSPRWSACLSPWARPLLLVLGAVKLTRNTKRNKSPEPAGSKISLMNTLDAKERAQDLLRETDNCIRANPVPAILTALGVGFAIGVLTRFVEPAPRREPWQGCGRRHPRRPLQWCQARTQSLFPNERRGPRCRRAGRGKSARHRSRSRGEVVETAVVVRPASSPLL